MKRCWLECVFMTAQEYQDALNATLTDKDLKEPYGICTGEAETPAERLQQYESMIGEIQFMIRRLKLHYPELAQ